MNYLYNLNNSEEIWNGVWLCQEADRLLNNLPIKIDLNELDEMTMFESYGSSYDLYCFGTWTWLNKLSEITTKLDKRVQEFAKIDRNKLRFKIPPKKKPPDNWNLPLEEYHDKNITKLINYLRNQKV